MLGARRLDRLEELTRELDIGPDAVVRTDVTQVDQVKALVDHAVAKHGRIDVLINNAGLMPSSMFDKLLIEEDAGLFAAIDRPDRGCVSALEM